MAKKLEKGERQKQKELANEERTDGEKKVKVAINW